MGDIRPKSVWESIGWFIIGIPVFFTNNKQWREAMFGKKKKR